MQTRAIHIQTYILSLTAKHIHSYTSNKTNIKHILTEIYNHKKKEKKKESKHYKIKVNKQKKKQVTKQTFI